MDGVTDSTGWLNPEGPDPQMEGPPSESFQSMQALLETWLAGAHVTDIAHLAMLAKGEPARRGITLTWSISQTDRPGRAC